MHRRDDDENNDDNNNNNNNNILSSLMNQLNMPNFTSKNLENSCNVMKHPVTKCHCVRTVKAGTAMNRSK